MALNAATMKLIMDSEGFRADAYPDPATGGEPLTIGFGHTSAAGPPKVTRGMRITRLQAEQILDTDLVRIEAQIRSVVRVRINSNQAGALASFVYNVGIGNFKSSTLLRLLNAGDYAGAANEFGKWTRAAGKVTPGLVKRRAAEAALFRTPAPGEAPQVPVPPATKKPASKAGFIIAAIVVLALVAFFIIKH